MEVQLNEQTNVDVSAKLSIFRTQVGEQEDILYVRNDRIYAAEVALRRGFSTLRFVIAFAVALLGGFAHFAYDTMILGYNPNPTIIGAIVVVITIIGVAISFTKLRSLMLTVDSNQDRKMFAFLVYDELEDKQLEDLMEVLVS